MRKPALSAVVKAWVRRLRSGKVKQAHHQLAIGDARCCLGVLCDLAVEKGIIKGYKRTASSLPDRVAAWAGLASVKGSYGIIDDALWQDNDGYDGRKPKSFKKIADIIVSQPEGLFNAKT